MSSQNRSDDQELVSKNLELIISSSNYQLAHEDRELLNSDEMRGVRMLLEIHRSVYASRKPPPSKLTPVPPRSGPTDGAATLAVNAAW